MKPLILVKHSLPEIVEDVPARDWKLSEEGRVRAQRLAEKLIQYQPEVVVSSVELKAQETARILTENFGLGFHVVDGLHEHERKYLSKDEFETAIREFFEKPDVFVFGSETAKDALLRFRQAVDSALNSYDDKSILIVAHGTVISLFVSWLTGCDGYHLWSELGLPSFVVLDLQAKTALKTINLP